MRYSVEPDMENFEKILSEQVSSRAIVMLNLLRFKEHAEYRDPSDAKSPCSGKQAYKRYAKAVLPLMLEVGGVPIWMGRVKSTLIAPSEERWDEAFLVAYPSRDTFIQMISTETYQKVMRHRTAALLDSRLVETYPKALPKTLLKAVGYGLRAKAFVFPRT